MACDGVERSLFFTNERLVPTARYQNTSLQHQFHRTRWREEIKIKLRSSSQNRTGKFQAGSARTISRIELNVTKRGAGVEDGAAAINDVRRGCRINRHRAKRGFAREAISREEPARVARSIPVYRVSSSSPPWYPW